MLYLVGDSNLRIQSVLWGQAIVKFVKTCEGCWNFINIKRAFLNKLYQCLRKAAYGASPALYNHFVIVLSLFPFIKLERGPAAKPIEKIEQKEQKEEEKKIPELSHEEQKKGTKEKEKKKKKEKESSDNEITIQEQFGIISDIMDNLFSAIYSEEAAIYHDKLVNSYFDCCLLILWKRILPFLQSNPEPKLVELAIETALKLLSKPLEIFKFTPEGASGQLPHRVYDLVSVHLCELFNNIRDRNLQQEFVQKLEGHALNLLSELFTGKNAVVSEIHINLLHSLCISTKEKEEYPLAKELVKLVYNFHSLLRKYISDEVTSPLKVIENLHLYCLVTYKFLVSMQKPLLSEAYVNMKEGERLMNVIGYPKLYLALTQIYQLYDTLF